MVYPGRRRKSKLRSLNVFDEFDGSSSKIDGLIFLQKNKEGIFFFLLINSGFVWLTSVQFSLFFIDRPHDVRLKSPCKRSWFNEALFRAYLICI